MELIHLQLLTFTSAGGVGKMERLRRLWSLRLFKF
jgi:hypothetical protein